MNTASSDVSRVSDAEWKQIMPRYRMQQKEWFVIPNFIWILQTILSIALIYFMQGYWVIAGIIVGFYSAAQMGSRSGNIGGFQIGYEWGKEEAIEQVYSPSPEQLNDNNKKNKEI